MTSLLLHPLPVFANLLLQDIALQDEVVFQQLDWFSIISLMISLAIGGVVVLLSTVFPIWMAIDCIRNDEEKGMWFWIILCFPCFGACVYFFTRYLPRGNFKTPAFISNMRRGREIKQLEIAAKQIGNPHQFVLLGDALRDTGKWNSAADAYDDALQKEPDNIQALWGAGLVAYESIDYEAADDYFQKVLQIDSQYKFGDVSLYRGKALIELQLNDDAIAHLEEHIKRYPQPEARYLLAALYDEEGETEKAREEIDELLMGIASSPISIAKKNRLWESKAKKLLKKL